MSKTFKAGQFELDLEKRTYIMGILNVTPDSFSDGGKWGTVDEAVKHALQMQNDGADIIDIGAQSTRTGFVKVSSQEELRRLLPVLQVLRGQLDVPISVDTFYPEVVKEALLYGASIINDVNGFTDELMIELASKNMCGCIITHNGPANKTKDFLRNQLEKMRKRNIDIQRICMDPGIGFGKTYEENLKIIKNLCAYSTEDCAKMIGLSRKSVIGIACGNIPVEERLPGTITANALAIAGGANIIRVHDVKEAVQAVKMVDTILRT